MTCGACPTNPPTYSTEVWDAPKYRWAVYFCPQYCGLCKPAYNPPPPPPSCECTGISLNFTGSTTNPNNLGNMGPDLNADPVIRYVQIDGNEPGEGLYDMVVANTSKYLCNAKDFDEKGVARGCQINGVSGEFGNVNIMQGTKTAFELCFYDTGTDNLATLEDFFLSYYDMDQGYDSGMTIEFRERLHMFGFAHYYVNQVEGDMKAVPDDPGTHCELKATGPSGGSFVTSGTLPDGASRQTGQTNVDWDSSEIQLAVCPEPQGAVGGGYAAAFYTNYPCTEVVISTSTSGVFEATSTIRGLGCDNPSIARQLTDVQAARTIMFEYNDKACIEADYEALGDFEEDSGRNFLFAGASFECGCDPKPPPPPPYEAPKPPPPPPPECSCGGTNLNFTGTSTDPSNLGNLGPDLNEDPVIRFIQIDGNSPSEGLYDLVIANKTRYECNARDFDEKGVARGCQLNGVFGEFGNVNVQQGLKVQMELCFFETGTNTPATLEDFYFSFYDMDQGSKSTATEVYREILHMQDFTHYYVNVIDTMGEVGGASDLKASPDNPGTKCIIKGENQWEEDIFEDGDVVDGAPSDDQDFVFQAVTNAVCEARGPGATTPGVPNPAPNGQRGGEGWAFYENYPCTEITITTSGSGVFEAAASVRGVGCDNPTTTVGLNAVQSARTIMFEFNDLSCIEMDWEAAGDAEEGSGRNFLFAGAAFDCACP